MIHKRFDGVGVTSVSSSIKDSWILLCCFCAADELLDLEEISQSIITQTEQSTALMSIRFSLEAMRADEPKANVTSTVQRLVFFQVCACRATRIASCQVSTNADMGTNSKAWYTRIKAYLLSHKV